MTAGWTEQYRSWNNMGKVTGFLEIDRQVHKYQPASDRIRHFREFTLPMSDKEVEKQAARCMDCGVPYCHGPTGCPRPQPDSGLERPRLPGRLGQRDPQPAFDQ
jgi:glutamate synthase (NADH) small subunit (EC 1.4.1.14)